ncbi:MAG: hypothetical protein OHK0036_12280 [Bacteroidia bacterium]
MDKVIQLNKSYFQNLYDKFKGVKLSVSQFSSKTVELTSKIIFKHYYENKLIHFNFQNNENNWEEVGKILFIELSNDIYRNHYLRPNYVIGDKLKRIKHNQYYEIIKIENNKYTIRQILSKRKTEISPPTLLGITYDRLTKNYVKLKEDKGISERTIKNYFNFFENLNKEKCEFPRLNFDRKIVFISKKTFWDSLNIKSKIPSIYLPNPREENHLSEIKSIPALTDCLVYFTPKYEVCYQNILLQNKRLKSIIVFDTEVTSIEQMLLDKQRFGFNLIILSNSLNPQKNNSIPCWNWFKEEVELVNAL